MVSTGGRTAGRIVATAETIAAIAAGNRRSSRPFHTIIECWYGNGARLLADGHRGDLQ
jgi:hypothetical protein